ncbi:hypothetical protein [Pseudohoeflea coraliihabitans]|uniref:Phage P22-like portal protein n=1 Tax=Pseudohoeflea coraliihabitans TaxID=2860393 RepID=A0ABS6WVV0_9HYPH|nr:hypothetical protein [Pseudohoeflea sp. DP4N28-3]MBW3099225.1 hypothetical protein [Pseudohoeflea sp. DP4N28-3]
MTYLKPGDPVPHKWKQWFREDEDHSSRWRKEAREDYDFAAGRQWSELDKVKLADEMRPAITFNRSSVVIDAVSGQEIQNRQEVRYIPREEGDAVVNEMYSEAARWFDDQSEAEDEDSEAFIDLLISGMGWTENRLDFEEDPDGAPVTEKCDPLEMFWDASARKSNLRDARRLWKIKEMPIDAAREQFPDFSDADIDAGKWANLSSTNEPNHNDPEHEYETEQEDEGIRSRKTVKVIHLQYWEKEPYYKVADPMSGGIAEFGEDEFRQLEGNFKRLGIPLKSVRLTRRVYKQAFIGQKLLEHSEGPCGNHFSWNCMTGKYDRNRAYWYGLIRAMKDPQTWANKWMSQLLHIMNSNSSGGWFYESGAFVDQRAAEEDLAKPNALVEVASGALQAGRVQPKQNAQFPQGYQLLTEYAVSAIRDVTGVNLELMGMREANQAGVLEYQRRQAGMAVLSTLFNSLRRYRRARGRVLLHYIHEYLSDGRLIMIVGDGRKQYVPLRKQTDAKYDIIIDDAPTSPNQKEIVWQSVMQILPGIKDMVPPQVLLQLLDYSPVPASVVEKIKQAVQKMGQEGEQQAAMQARAAVLEVQQKEADVQKTQSEAYENQMEAELDKRRAAVEEAKVGADILRDLVEMNQPQQPPQGPQGF